MLDVKMSESVKETQGKKDIKAEKEQRKTFKVENGLSGVVQEVKSTTFPPNYSGRKVSAPVTASLSESVAH